MKLYKHFERERSFKLSHLQGFHLGVFHLFSLKLPIEWLMPYKEKGEPYIGFWKRIWNPLKSTELKSVEIHKNEILWNPPKVAYHFVQAAYRLWRVVLSPIGTYLKGSFVVSLHCSPPVFEGFEVRNRRRSSESYWLFD